uniref:Uncharacterized protein n=1 Tax=Anguilla anguilla TaxID=7936 RepID=A0A0E9VMP8_ANGAN
MIIICLTLNADKRFLVILHLSCQKEKF